MLVTTSAEYDGTFVDQINRRGTQFLKPDVIFKYKYMESINHLYQILSYYTCEYK